MILDELFDIKLGIPLNRIKSNKKTDFKCRAFTIKSLENRTIIESNLEEIYLNQETFGDIYSKEGDILMKGSLPFSFAYVSKEWEGILIPSNFYILRLKEEYKEKILPQYVLYKLHSKDVNNQLKRILQGTGAVITFSKQDLQFIEVQIPKIGEQEKRLKLFNLMDKKLNFLRKKIELEEKLLKGIINNY